MASSVNNGCRNDCCDYDGGGEFLDTAGSAVPESLSRVLRSQKPIDFHSGDGKAVMIWACERGRLDIMKLLAEHGAPIEFVV